MQTTILFDLDGTLIDSTEAILEAFHYACRENAFDLPKDEEIKALIGHPLDEMFFRLGVERHQTDIFVNSYKTLYRQISESKTKLLPFAEEAIISAGKFARLGIVTTKTAHYSEILLEHIGVMHHFEVLIGRENVTHPKPHPEPVHKALEAMQSTPESTWLIGDTCMDILSAREAGIRGIAVASGYASKAQLESCQSEIKEHALEAVEWIRENR